MMTGSNPQRRAQRISDQYAFQTQLIRQLTAGISDDESLLQMPFESNCMNWILGHVISRRQTALEALGSEPLWGNEQLARYKTGSDPISTADQAVKFSILRNDLDRSMDMLQTALQEADHQVLDQLVINDRGEKTAAEHLEGFLWHETYHIGQLEILRSFIKSIR